MSNKPYPIEDNTPAIVNEPAVAYRSASIDTSSSNAWDPNVPFCGTQEEWWDHFHRIEEGEFTSWEEHQKEFEAWKKEFLASRNHTPNAAILPPKTAYTATSFSTHI
jgi:hypothetical protein